MFIWNTKLPQFWAIVDDWEVKKNKDESRKLIDVKEHGLKYEDIVVGNEYTLVDVQIK